MGWRIGLSKGAGGSFSVGIMPTLRPVVPLDNRCVCFLNPPKPAGGGITCSAHRKLGQSLRDSLARVGVFFEANLILVVSKAYPTNADPIVGVPLVGHVYPCLTDSRNQPGAVPRHEAHSSFSPAFPCSICEATWNLENMRRYVQ